MANKKQFIKMIIDLHKQGSLFITDDGILEFGKLLQEEFDEESRKPIGWDVVG